MQPSWPEWYPSDFPISIMEPIDGIDRIVAKNIIIYCAEKSGSAWLEESLREALYNFEVI